jgi:hypothetical protein
MHGRAFGFGLLGLGLAFLTACFGNPSTLGLPCTDHDACFDGLVCGAGDVCVEPSAADAADTGDGDGDTGDGDGDTGDGDGEPGDGDGETGDGDGDGDGDIGDGDGDTGDGDGDGDPPEPICGNGILEVGELCDGMQHGDKTCADFAYGGGTLACDDDCEFDLTDCCLGTGQACTPLQSECCEAFSCLNLMMVCG